ncbi:DNA cytosine methyltransferase [Paenibacillus xylanexedens]|uniref:DNA cytosine methyltransferase n=1 Tax=Paenibacillus xylanexedens TaxID=528191 RepID=UPI003B0203AA
MKILNAIDIFSGVGGSSEALKRYFKIISSVEMDPIIAKSYELNHGKDHLYIGNIRDIGVDYWNNLLMNHKNKLDLLVSTPPCQGFSKHSRTKILESNDERNTLILETIRIAHITKPKFIFFENVPNIIYYKIFHTFLKKLSNIKKDGTKLLPNLPSYHIRYECVDAYDYNVPQKRKRMILLAKRIDQFPNKDAYIRTRNVTAPIVNAPLNIWPDKIPAPTLNAYLSQFKLSLLNAGETDMNDKLHRARSLSNLNLKRIRATPHNGGSRKNWDDSLVLDCHRKKNVSFGDVYGRMSNQEYSPTITCGCVSYSKGRFGHPTEDRAISLREAALIQTFPYNYKFTGKLTGELYEGSFDNIATQIGNAVPVNLADIFFREISKYS